MSEDPPPGPWIPLALALVLFGGIALVVATNDRIGALGFVEVILTPALVGVVLLWVAVTRFAKRRR